MRDIKIEIINTTEQIGDLVDWLVFRHAPPAPYSPTMYIDLEGVDLYREGSLSILTLMIDTGIPTRRLCLFDVHLLGAQAFNTAGVNRRRWRISFRTTRSRRSSSTFATIQMPCLRISAWLCRGWRIFSLWRVLRGGLLDPGSSWAAWPSVLRKMCSYRSMVLTWRAGMQRRRKGRDFSRLNMAVRMKFSTSARSRKDLFYIVLVMSCASLSCGIGSGKGPMVGETRSMKKARSASRHLRNQSTSPTAQIGRWLRGPKTRIGLWMSGITSLLLATTSMKIGSTKVGTMTGATTILKIGRGRPGKGLRSD